MFQAADRGISATNGDALRYELADPTGGVPLAAEAGSGKAPGKNEDGPHTITPLKIARAIAALSNEGAKICPVHCIDPCRAPVRARGPTSRPSPGIGLGGCVLY